MNSNDVGQLVEALKGVIEIENKKLEQNLESKIGNLETHNKHHKMLDKYDEIFNEETMDILRELALKAIEKHKQKEKINDYIMKTMMGSLTITALGVLYAIGKFVILNINKIL